MGGFIAMNYQFHWKKQFQLLRQWVYGAWQGSFTPHFVHMQRRFY